MPFESNNREPGIGLALSGGGFRAVLFHCGALIRLNEFAVLSKLARISSVSGGSIVNGVLATRWTRLVADSAGRFTNLQEVVIDPLRRLCSKTMDTWVVLGGAINPLRSAGEQSIRTYRKELGLEMRLKDLSNAPRFIWNATNYATGVSFRFSKPYSGDYRIGLIRGDAFDVATAVGCSSAFPPVLAPVILEMQPDSFEKTPGADLYDHEDFRRRLILADGGVYDNLGLETVWDRYATVLVSDGGKPFDVEPDAGTELALGQLRRVMDIGLNQALAVRKRWLINDMKLGADKGAYWGIGTPIRKYDLPDALDVPEAQTNEMAALRTRLNKFSGQEQKDLINWGYAVSDAAMRKHCPGLTVGAMNAAYPVQ